MNVCIQIQHAISSSFQLDVKIDSSQRLIGLTGPSGSGKTSILHVVAGLIKADQSHIEIAGESIADLKPAQRKIGLAMQSPHLFPHLSTRQNLNFGAHTDPNKDAISTVAEWLEITDLLDRAPRHLSGGERQRVALGRAILSNPRALLLDEPFAAVDADRTQRIASQLKRHIERANIAMILVSHDTDLLRTLADEIIPVVQGSAVWSETSMPQQVESD